MANILSGAGPERGFWAEVGPAGPAVGAPRFDNGGWYLGSFE